jgi:hypothetical protein
LKSEEADAKEAELAEVIDTIEATLALLIEATFAELEDARASELELTAYAEALDAE